jgi:hypothetical protein
MAPRVPYQPFPTVQPIGQGADRIRVDTPNIGPEAFGAEVGQALKGFGQVTEQASNELFNRAMAFKELDNRNAATMRSADFADSASKMHEQFKNQEGMNATKAWQTFPDNLEAERQRIRESLPNDMTKKLYDSETRGIYNQNLRSAADWAGNQHRVATDQATDARVATLQKQAGINVTDPAALKQSLDGIQAAMMDKAQQKGWLDESGNLNDKGKYEVFAAKSGAIANKLKIWSNTEPFKASDQADVLKDQLTDADYDAVKHVTDVQRRNVGSRMIVSDIRTGRDHVLGNQPVSLQRAKDAIGGFESGNNYTRIGPMTRHGEGLGRYQVMEEFLPDYLKRAGMPPMTREQFLANPQAQDEVFEKTFVADMQKYGSFNEAASRWLTGKGLAEAIAEGKTDVNNTDVGRYLTKTNAILAQGAPERDVMAAATTKGNALVPPEKDALFEVAVQGAVQSQTAIDRSAARDRAVERRNTLIGALSQPGPDGKYITSRDELFQNPASKAAYLAATDEERADADKHLIANASRGYAPTEDKWKRYYQIKGMLDTQEGKVKFAGMDLLAEKLPNFMYANLLQTQTAMKARAGEDPRISVIFQDGAAVQQMRTLGLTQQQNADAYWEFRGRLQTMLDVAQQHTGAPLDKKTMMEVFNDMLRQTVVSGFWSQTGLDKIFGADLSEPFYQDVERDLEQDPRWATMSPEERAAVVRTQYEKVWLSRHGDRRAGGE